MIVAIFLSRNIEIKKINLSAHIQLFKSAEIWWKNIEENTGNYI